ncbi:MAG: hypothetical protein QMB65_09280 [Vicingaceae bacterium]
MKSILTLLFLTIISLPFSAQDSDDPFEVYNVRNEEDGSTIVYARNNYLCDECIY